MNPVHFKKKIIDKALMESKSSHKVLFFFSVNLTSFDVQICCKQSVSSLSLSSLWQSTTWHQSQIPLRFIFRGCLEVCAPGEQTHLYPSFILPAISKCLMKTTPDRNDSVLYQPKLAALTRRYCQHSYTHAHTHTKWLSEKCY